MNYYNDETRFTTMAMNGSSMTKNFISIVFSKRFGKYIGSFFVVMFLKHLTLKVSTIIGHPIVIPDFVQMTMVVVMGLLMSYLWVKVLKPLLIVALVGVAATIVASIVGSTYHIKNLVSNQGQVLIFLVITGTGLLWLLVRPIFRRFTRPFYFKTIEQIDKFGNGNNKVGGTMFEDYLVLMFRQLGYNASTIAELKQKGIVKIKSVDQGADILLEYLEDNQVKTSVIQCKHYSSSVGNKAVQEAYSAMGFYEAHSAIVLTNNYFTAEARELATKLNIALMDREKLIQLNTRAAQPRLARMLAKSRLAA